MPNPYKQLVAIPWVTDQPSTAKPDERRRVWTEAQIYPGSAPEARALASRLNLPLGEQVLEAPEGGATWSAPTPEQQAASEAALGRRRETTPIYAKTSLGDTIEVDRVPTAEYNRRQDLLAMGEARKETQKQSLLANILSLGRSYWGAADRERQARRIEGANALNTLLGTEFVTVPKGATVIDRETRQPIVEDPATVAGRKVAGIMGGGMGRTVADLERQRDALRLLPVPTAQGLADDVQRRIDALEAAPGKTAEQERGRAREARDIETHGLTVKEFQAREQERTERQKDREARRKRLEDAASGKNPLSTRELMTDRSGLLAEQRRLEDRFDISEEEKQQRMRDIDEELNLVRGELEKARRRERGVTGQGLNPRQQAAVDAAPEGHRFKLGGAWHVKRGGRLVPEGQ